VTDDDALALALPDVFDQLLADVAADALPESFPPPLTGADLISDIWNLLNYVWAGAQRLLYFPLDMGRWMWDRFTDTWRVIGDNITWLWDALIAPAFWSTWAAINQAKDWLWYSAVQPGLNYLWALVAGRLDWLWGSAVQPALNYLWALVAGRLDWLWGSAIQPSLQWIYNRIWDTAQSFWSSSIQPALNYLWALVSGTFTWLWGSAISPALDSLRQFVFDRTQWIYDHIVAPSLDWLGDRLDNLLNIGQETKDIVVNNVWPTLREIPTALPGLVTAGGQLLVGGIRDALDWLFNHVFDPIADAIQTKLSIPRKLMNVQYRDINELLDDLEDPIPYGSFFGGAQAILGVPGMIMAMSSEIGRVLAMDATQRWAQHVGATLPTLTDLRDAYLRGLITPTFHDDQLSRFGFSTGWVNAIRDLYFEIPTPSDLVRMAVREAFTPAVVERFRTHEDFPPDFEKWAHQIGISRDWALAHWAAHWDLPSATQGFDMFHRALDSPAPGTDSLPFTVGGENFFHIIDAGTLDLLLRTLDVMPYWRDRMTAIAFRPISRIDIRRMFASGAADRRDVLRTYLSLGYLPADATALTDWVTREAAGVSKDLSREVIIKAYREGRLTHDQATDELLELGYADDQVDLLLDLADVEVEDQLAKLAEDVFEQDFKAGIISESDVRAALAFIGVPARRIELLVRLWARQMAVRPAKLTTAQVQRLYREGIIGRPQAEFLLANLAYNPTAIGWLLELATPEPDLPPARELSKEDLRTALRQELMSEPEVRARLVAMRWTPTDVDLLLQMWSPTPKEADLTKADLRTAFRAGVLSTDQVRDSLTRQGFDPTEIESLLAIWTPAPDVETLTRADLRAAFRAGILDQVTVTNALIARGYPPDEAAILIDTWAPAPAAA